MNTELVPTAENPDVRRILSDKPGVDQNIAFHALSATKNSVCFISALLVIQLHFSPDIFQHQVTCVTSSDSDFPV